MDPALAWLLAGLALIVVELLTGTFYLLILGLAAGIGSLAAWLGTPVWMQALIVGVAGVVGCVILHKRKLARPSRPADNQMDVGQTVTVESWISEPQRLARVRYRGAPWEAEILGSDAVAPGAILYVVATEGNRLKVAANRSA
jgi:membrane protein implicated in regulation of membrane protease activity